MTDVWIVESGDYEMRGVDGVAASLAAGLAWIKAKHGAPYVVAWDEPEQRNGAQWDITGHFSAVPGYSIQHTAYFSLTCYEVVQEAS